MSRLHRGKARWGQGGTRSRCCLHLPCTSKKQTSPRTPKGSAREADSTAKPQRAATAAGAKAKAMQEVREDVDPRGAHAEILWLGGNRINGQPPIEATIRSRGENLEAAGWNL